MALPLLPLSEPARKVMPNVDDKVERAYVRSRYEGIPFKDAFAKEVGKGKRPRNLEGKFASYNDGLTEAERKVVMRMLKKKSRGKRGDKSKK